MPDGEHLPRVERMIREAQAAGEFDDLPGAGKPIDDLERAYEAGWWAKRFVARQRLSDDAMDLAARLRREVPAALSVTDELGARRRLEDLNGAIAALNADLPEDDRLQALDVDRLVEERRRRHSHQKLT